MSTSVADTHTLALWSIMFMLSCRLALQQCTSQQGLARQAVIVLCECVDVDAIMKQAGIVL
jgi:hypothetical protein